jgi:hypothetical protein
VEDESWVVSRGLGGAPELANWEGEFVVSIDLHHTEQELPMVLVWSMEVGERCTASEN